LKFSDTFVSTLIDKAMITISKNPTATDASSDVLAVNVSISHFHVKIVKKFTQNKSRLDSL
jgi:hypothetical protein